MNGFLLDTNVPSELTKPKSDTLVEKWLDDANDELLFFSVVSLGEIFKGLTLLLRASAARNCGNGLTRPCVRGSAGASCR
jgi:predicted nucleic acid-binding protein